MLKLEFFDNGKYSEEDFTDREYEANLVAYDFIEQRTLQLERAGYQYEILEEEDCISILGKNKSLFAYVKVVEE